MKVIKDGKKYRHACDPQEEKDKGDMPQLPEGSTHRRRNRLKADHLADLPVTSMHITVMAVDGLG